MNNKRAMGVIFVLIIAVHTTSIIISRLLGVNLETIDPANMPSAIWCLALLSVFILSTLGAIWFFQSPLTTPNAKNGFVFGLAACIFGFLTDIFLLVRLRDGLNIILKYFAQSEYWMAFILILVACTFVGYVNAKNRN